MSDREAQLDALYDRARRLSGQPGREAEIVELLGVYLPHRQGHGNAWFVYGNALHRIGRTYDAEKAFIRAIDRTVARDKVWVHAALAQVHADRGDRIEAEKWFASATGHEPTAGAVWVCRGRNFAAMGNLTAAEECHRNAAALDGPHQAEAYANIGLVLRASQRYMEAISAFKSALEFDPDHAEAQRALDGLRRIREAIKQTRTVSSDQSESTRPD